MAQAVDYSWARPGGAVIKAAGFVGALRYLSYEPGKNLSLRERDDLFAHGIAIGLVWESVANRPLGGGPAGQSDGAAARAQADALGHPTNRPIYFAMDTDYNRSHFNAMAEYLKAAKFQLGGRPVGIYAGADFVDWAIANGVADFGWVAGAFSWSHEQWHGGLPYTKYAHLMQLPGYVLGNTCDANNILQADWGQWPAPNGVPQHPQEEEMSEYKDWSDASKKALANDLLFTISGYAAIQNQDWAKYPLGPDGQIMPHLAMLATQDDIRQTQWGIVAAAANVIAANQAETAKIVAAVKGVEPDPAVVDVDAIARRTADEIFARLASIARDNHLAQQPAEIEGGGH